MSALVILVNVKDRKVFDEIPQIRTHNQIGQSNPYNVSFCSYLKSQKRVSS